MPRHTRTTTAGGWRPMRIVSLFVILLLSACGGRPKSTHYPCNDGPSYRINPDGRPPTTSEYPWRTC